MRAKLERGCLGGCALPFFLLGVLLVLWGGLAALILPLGQQTTGIVTERERGNGNDKTYNLKFRFRADESTYDGQWLVPVSKWKYTRVGDSVRVRYFPFAPGVRPLLEDGVSPWVSILVVAPLGFLMLGTFGPLLLSVVKVRNGKHLVRCGLLTPAFIVRRDDHKGTLTFLLRDLNGRVVEIEARPKNLTVHYAGQIEPALYFPNKPQNARLVRWLDWKAVAPKEK